MFILQLKYWNHWELCEPSVWPQVSSPHHSLGQASQAATDRTKSTQQKNTESEY